MKCAQLLHQICQDTVDTDVEILIVLHFYLLHKNAHNLQVRKCRLFQLSNAMLQSHYICQQTNVTELYIIYIFMIVDIDFSRADFISLLVSF